MGYESVRITYCGYKFDVGLWFDDITKAVFTTSLTAIAPNRKDPDYVKALRVITEREVVNNLRTSLEKRLGRVVKSQVKNPLPQSTPMPKPYIGSVIYVIKSGDLHKIGITGQFDHRLASLRTSSPLPIEVIAIIKHASGKDERTLHELFANKRKHGEWFALTDEDVEYIKGLAS